MEPIVRPGPFRGLRHTWALLALLWERRRFFNRCIWSRDEWALAAVYLVIWLLTPDQQLDLLAPQRPVRRPIVGPYE